MLRMLVLVGAPLRRVCWSSGQGRRGGVGQLSGGYRIFALLLQSPWHGSIVEHAEFLEKACLGR